MEEKEKKGQKGNGWRVGLTVVVMLLVMFAIVFVVVQLLTGKTTKTEGKIEDFKTQSLTCAAEGADYPFFTYDSAENKTAQITVLFSGGKLKSIALNYSLYYADKQAVDASEAHNHAAMNKSFASSGLKTADAYSAQYAKMPDRMQMNLYTGAKEMDLTAAKYFMLDMTSDYGIPDTLNGYKEEYEKRGFICEQKTE